MLAEQLLLEGAGAAQPNPATEALIAQLPADLLVKLAREGDSFEAYDASRK